MGFEVQTLKAEGRPSFDTKIFLKLYLYGYLNGLRSSRKLERECARNTEMRWLLIDRSQYADAVEENNQRYQENQQLYRKRQEINEHIFGTIKRQWGYNHTNSTGLEKVNGEHSLIMLSYNIKRTINILGVPDLIARFKKWKSPYKSKAWILFKTIILKLFPSRFEIQFYFVA